MFNDRRPFHQSFLTLLAVSGFGVVSAACTGSAADSNDLRDGAGVSTAQSTTPLASSCSTPSENCPCSDDGLTAACTGPKIHVGGYTSCLPGVRVCMSGTWGACVGRTVYQNVDGITQDYASPCAGGTHVRWGALTIQGETPDGSEIAVGVQTGDTEAALDRAPATLVGAFDGTTSSAWPGIDVGSALAGDAIPSGQRLRVTLRLIRASSSSASPVVLSFQQASQCIAD